MARWRGISRTHQRNFDGSLHFFSRHTNYDRRQTRSGPTQSACMDSVKPFAGVGSWGSPGEQWLNTSPPACQVVVSTNLYNGRTPMKSRIRFAAASQRRCSECRMSDGLRPSDSLTSPSATRPFLTITSSRCPRRRAALRQHLRRGRAAPDLPVLRPRKRTIRGVQHHRWLSAASLSDDELRDVPKMPCAVAVRIHCR